MDGGFQNRTHTDQGMILEQCADAKGSIIDGEITHGQANYHSHSHTQEILLKALPETLEGAVTTDAETNSAIQTCGGITDGHHRNAGDQE